MTKRTLGGTKLKAVRQSGFRARMTTKSGRKIIQSRRQRKRQNLSLS